MVLSDMAVRRPVLAAVVAILISLVGAIAFTQLPVREYPQTDPPIVSADTTYTGAAAAVVESRITQLIEERLAGVPGVRTLTSRSRDGNSSISIEFDPGRNVDEAANDVRDRVAGVLDNLPDEARPPEVNKVNNDEQAVLWLTAEAPTWSPIQLTDYVDRVIADRFASIDGVARVQISGEARPAMRVWLDPSRLAAYQMTPGDVETALRRQNVELPAGRIEAENQNVTVRVNRPFTTADQFRALVIGRGADGYQIRLGDVARVEEGRENPYSDYRSNGVPGVGIGIVRQSGANTLDVANRAKAQLAEISRTLPAGVTLDIGFDQSLFIERAIEKVYVTLAEAGVLVVAVIFLFLGSWRATLIPAVTVPVCLLATFAVLWLCGFSINLLTLLAMVLSIGLVVDDAIVVLENVYHRIEQGEPPLAAAFQGTRQVAFAVIATTLVVCAVFVPVMFISGTTGLLFRELAAAMIGALMFSGLLALTLTPMLCSKMLKHEERGRLAAMVDRRFRRLEAGYGRLLDKVIRRPLPLVVILVVTMVVSGVVFVNLRSELAPREDTGFFGINISAPEGTGFAALDRYTREVEDAIKPMIDDGSIRKVTTRLPGNFGASDDFNNARIQAFMANWEDRDVSTAQVVDEVNRRLRNVASVRASASNPSSLGGGRPQPIDFVIAGSNYQDLARARDAIIAAAASNPGIIDLDSDYKETKPQLLIDVDTQRAGDLGVSVDAVSQALQTLMGSRRVTTYIDRGEEYRVIVQADAPNRANERDLASVYVRGTAGQLVPLSNLVTTRESADARELGRFNKMRAITLSGNLGPGYSLGEALNFLENEAAKLPAITAVGYRGQSKAFRETGGAIWVIFGVTIVVVFLLLAAQFESFVHPAVIIVTVPLAVAGGILGIAITGHTLNLFSQIGIVMLVGLAAKNGILIVEFANQLRDEGMAFGEAIQAAAIRRLRPILMTSIATVAGAVPLAIATGAGAGARSAIGVVIIFGVSLATILTLFVVPLVYDRVARRTGSPLAVTRRLEAELAGAPAE